MYKCEICNNIISSGVRCHKLVAETRKKDYLFRPKVFPGYTQKDGATHRSRKSRDRLDDRGGSGWEIAREQNCCPSCKAKIDRDK